MILYRHVILAGGRDKSSNAWRNRCKEIAYCSLPELLFPIVFVTRVALPRIVRYQSCSSPYCSLPELFSPVLFVTRVVLPRIVRYQSCSPSYCSLPELLFPVVFVTRVALRRIFRYQSCCPSYFSLTHVRQSWCYHVQNCFRRTPWYMSYFFIV